MEKHVMETAGIKVCQEGVCQAIVSTSIHLGGNLAAPLAPGPAQGDLKGGLEALGHLAVHPSPQLPGIEGAGQQHAPVAPDDLVPDAQGIPNGPLLACKDPALHA